MSSELLRPQDKRLLLIVVALVAGASWFTVRFYEEAFPQASLHLKYSKSEITGIARDFLVDHGLSTAGFRNLTLFKPDHSARLFLERELGLKAANLLMEGEVAVWRWRARWFKPPEKEELLVYLSPDGRLVGFRHLIAETQDGSRLEKDEAFALAQTFLDSRTELPHRLVEDQLNERPNRFDYTFTWEQEEFRAKDATYRRSVTIQGGRVGAYSEYLHVPERWEREYTKLRSSNALYGGIANALFLVLGVAAIGFLIQFLRRHEIRWKPLIVIGGVAGAVAVIDQWNLLPFYIDSMPTSSGYGKSVLLSLLQGLGAGVFYFFYIVLPAAPGEPFYRRFGFNRLSLPELFTLDGLRSREFFRATVAGYGFAAAHMVFLIGFYLVSKRFGAWSPQDVGHSDLLSTSLPWIYPLSVGILASLSEEFWFRLLAIPLLKKYLRSTFLAVVIPAIVWGFLHSNYPQQPGFIRGIEVGLIGVAAGFLMLRFGILATLVWHYTIDAVLVSTILFESDSPYLWGSGALVSGALLIPFAYALWQYRLHRGFTVPRVDATPGRSPEPEPPELSPSHVWPEPAIGPTWMSRWLLLAAAVTLALGLICRPFVFGDFISVRVSQAEAQEIADRAFAERGMDPSLWRRASWFSSNLDAVEFEYIRRLEGPNTASDVIQNRETHGIWSVRYFRPMQPEEWRVLVNQEGEAWRIDHLLEETAAGANLEAAEARKIAREHLEDVQRIPMDTYNLVDSREEKREARTDHHFVWEDKDFRVGEATARVSVTIVGDEVSFFRRHLKLPEQWLREFHQPRLSQYVLPALGGAVGLPLLLIFLRRIGSRQISRAQKYHWKAYVTAGVVAALVSVASGANQWAGMLTGYSTAEPLENHVGQWILGRLTLVLLTGLGTFFLFMAGDVFLQLATGHRRFPEPSIWRSVATAAILWGLIRAATVVGQWIPGDRFAAPLWSIPGPGTSLPFLAVLSQSLFVTLFAGVAIVIAGATVKKFLLNRRGIAVLAVVLALAAVGRSAGIAQWAYHLVVMLALVAVLLFLIRVCGVDVAGLACALFWLQAGALSVDLIQQPAAFLRWNGYVALFAGLLTGTVFLVTLRARVRRAQQAAELLIPS